MEVLQQAAVQTLSCDEYRAAVGLTMLERIEEVLEKREALFSHYEQLLASYFDLPVWNKKTSVKNGCYFPIILQNQKERLKPPLP